MSITTLDKRWYLILLLIGLVACVPTSGSTIETERPEMTAVKEEITPTPVATVVIDVDVIWNEGDPVTKDDPRIQNAYWHLFELSTEIENDIVTINASYGCGDECGGNETLVVQDNGTQNLPSFVSFHQSESDVFDDTSSSFSLQNGTLVIGEWDINGIMWGYVEDGDGTPIFYFWHNLGDEA